MWWRIGTFLVFGVMSASLMLSAFLIYNYTFRTLEDAHTIILLNTDTVVNTINMDNYQKATKIIKDKTTPSKASFVDMRNFFNYSSGATAGITTSTTVSTSTVSSTYVR